MVLSRLQMIMPSLSKRKAIIILNPCTGKAIKSMNSNVGYLRSSSILIYSLFSNKGSVSLRNVWPELLIDSII